MSVLYLILLKARCTEKKTKLFTLHTSLINICIMPLTNVLLFTAVAPHSDSLMRHGVASEHRSLSAYKTGHSSVETRWNEITERIKD
jgi:hypothetical protein